MIQVLVHFSTEVMGRTLARLGMSTEATLAFASPIYLMELLMTARHFAQSHDLYAAIQMNNPATADVTETFVKMAEACRRTLLDGDRAAFTQMFEEVRSFFGPFTEDALHQSAFLVDRLVERM